MSSGKRWEANVLSSLGKSCIRLYDTTNGFAGVKNPCDFIYYTHPNRVLIECKSVEGKSLPFNDITDNQWQQLSMHSKQFGVIAGIAVEFRSNKKCYFIPMVVLELILQAGKKSLNIDMCRHIPTVVDMQAQYKRTNCSFDKAKFDTNIKQQILVKQAQMKEEELYEIIAKTI